MADPDRRAVAAQALRAWCGIVVPENRLPALERELAIASGPGGPEEGLRRFLSGEPLLRARMARTVATSETSLFRHPAHFRLLADIVQRTKAARRPCRVLSAGCSTGEEAWSAAAVVAAASSGDSVAGSVVGWDLLDERVSHAGAGRFGPWASRNGVTGYEHLFVRQATVLVASAAVRRVVSFEAMNLLAIPATEPRRFDAIFFRNVCIYWDAATTAAVVRRLVDLLDVDGVLFIGPCDPIAAPDARWIHEIVDGVRRIRARRAEDGAKAPRAVPPPAPPAPLAERPSTPVARAAARPAPVRARVPAPDEPVWREEGLIDRVRGLADGGDYAAALALLERSPVAPGAEEFKWRGILALNLGDPDGAVTALRSCTFLAPRDAEGRRWLAVAYEAIGAGKDADREWRNAREVEDVA